MRSADTGGFSAASVCSSLRCCRRRRAAAARSATKNAFDNGCFRQLSWLPEI